MALYSAWEKINSITEHWKTFLITLHIFSKHLAFSADIAHSFLESEMGAHHFQCPTSLPEDPFINSQQQASADDVQTRLFKGPSTLATLFNHMWRRHVAATCMLCIQTLCLWRGRATACRTLEPQTAVCSPKLENNGFLRE